MLKKILPILILAAFLCFPVGCLAGEKISYNRIISLYPAHTENLVYLGASDKLIGISTSDTYPESILDKPRFHYREDPEKFIASRPDLVLIRPMIENGYPQFVRKLRQAGIEVISLQPTSARELYPYWLSLGELVGREQKAEQLITNFQNSLSQFDKALEQVPTTQRPKVYFESIHRRMKTFSQEAIAIFALTKAGGINIAVDARQVRNTNIAEYSKERILAKAMSIDVFLAQHGRMNPVTKETIMEEPGFKAIKAVQKDQVYLIDEVLISRPTPRIIEGIELIHNILYPAGVIQ